MRLVLRPSWSRLFKLIYIWIISFFFLVPQETMENFFSSYPINHNLVVVALFVSIILFLAIKRTKHSKLLIAIISYCSFVIFDTFLMKANLSYCVLMYGRFILTCMLVENMLARKDYDMLRAFTDGLNVLVLINLVSMFNFYITSGMGKTFFLGFDNGNCIVIFPTIIYNKMLCEIQQKKKICFRMIYVWIISVTSVYLLNSATTTIGMIMFVLIIIFRRFDVFHFMRRKSVFITVIFVLFFSINLLRLQTYFSYVIVDLLGRDLTFTGRVALWDKAIKGIATAPILGHGVDPQAQRLYFLGVSSAHNQIFDVLYQTGLVGMLFFVSMLILYAKKRIKSQNSSIVSMDSYINDMIFAFMLMMLIESYNSYISFGLILSLFVLSEGLTALSEWKEKSKLKLIWR